MISQGQAVPISTTASTAAAGVAPARRRPGDRRAATVERLLDAARIELRHSTLEGLSMRSVARRAGVAPATAYTYFSSKEHLVAEVFWRLVALLPPHEPDPDGSLAERAAATLSSVAMMIEAEPELSRACTKALLADDPDVRRLRDQIGQEWSRRVEAAVGDEAGPEQVAVLLLAWSGALLAAGIGHLRYSDLPARMASVAEVVFRTS